MSNQPLQQQYQRSERFWVDYIMEASSREHVMALAREVCLEQTVELPGVLDAVKEVEAYTVGTIERVELISKAHNHSSMRSNTTNSIYRVIIAYPNDTAGEELPQFLNVVFGNTSLKFGISVENVTLSSHLMNNRNMFPGPRFGIEGLRKLVNVARAPLLCTALKPMGRSSQEFADMAYSLAKGGIDIIKDDHGLGNQVWAPFKERIRLCSESVLRANQETGRNSLYAPCLNCPSDKIIKRAFYAKECGAGAVMLLPGLSGWDVVRQLASNCTFGLPILIHPAMLGGWLQTHYNDLDNSDKDCHPRGLSHKFLFGVLPRLCGGDAIIFPNAGGRFQFSQDECQQIAEGCRRPMGRFQSALPSPSGGMKLDFVPDMRKTFGDDTLFLIGGALLEQGPDLEVDARLFAHRAGRDHPYCSVGEFPKSLCDDADLRRTSTNSRAAKEKAHATIHISPPIIAEIERVANAVRRCVLEYTLKNNGGYLSQACSSAETLATLYLKSLRLGPSVLPIIPPPFWGSPGPGIATITGEGYNGDPTAPHLDRLIFSPVHYALPLYSLLVETGRLSVKALDSYNKDGSTVELIGAEHSPGHAVTAGSLAQALSQAAGIAYARKLQHHTGRVFVFMSDGEMQEGQTWEAVQAMVFHHIELTAVVDVNGQQCDGKMESVCDVGSLANKLRAFGAVVREVDGHNIQAIDDAVTHKHQSGPTFVLCYTDPCHGLPLLREMAPKLHYIRFKNSTEKLKWENILASMEKSHRDDSEENSPKPPNYRGKQIVHQRKLNAPPSNTQLEQCSVLRQVEIVVRPHQRHLLEWMKVNPSAIVLTADLTSSCEADFVRENLPNQYLSMGMAEQHMISFAGGLAREGMRPFIHTFGVFATRRPFDQVSMSIGVPNLPVRLLGFLPGLTTPGGVTHQAVDDVALMRSIPNMRILEVGDATEVESVLDVANSIDGPVYIRMLRGDVPRLFPQHSQMKFGVARVLSNNHSCLSRDSDVAIITSGICTEEALKARSMIQSSDVTVLHVHLSTLIPFPTDVILSACNMTKFGIITMENHSIVGGVGSAVAEVLAEHAVSKPLIRLGVPNGTYCHGASREYLMRENGFDASALIRAIEKLTHQPLTQNWLEGTGNGSHSCARNDHAGKTERPEDL